MAGRNLYRGMAFPFGPRLKDYFEPKSDKDILRTSIETIIMTRIGERVMLPGFGSPIQETPFEPNDDELGVILEGIVQDNVPFWDQRLEAVSVSVAPDDENNAVTVSVIYRDKATPDFEDRFSFTVPTEIVSRID